MHHCIHTTHNTLLSTLTKQVDEVLRTWEGTLRAVFDIYAFGDGVIGDPLNDNKLLGFGEWHDLIEHLGECKAACKK